MLTLSCLYIPWYFSGFLSTSTFCVDSNKIRSSRCTFLCTKAKRNSNINNHSPYPLSVKRKVQRIYCIKRFLRKSNNWLVASSKLSHFEQWATHRFSFPKKTQQIFFFWRFGVDERRRKKFPTSKVNQINFLGENHETSRLEIFCVLVLCAA